MEIQFTKQLYSVSPFQTKDYTFAKGLFEKYFLTLENTLNAEMKANAENHLYIITDKLTLNNLRSKLVASRRSNEFRYRWILFMFRK